MQQKHFEQTEFLSDASPEAECSVHVIEVKDQEKTRVTRCVHATYISLILLAVLLMALTTAHFHERTLDITTDTWIHIEKELTIPSTTTHIIQVGPERTATTFQFQTLCAMSFVKFKHQSIECNFNKWTSKRDVLITKAHNFDKARQRINNNDTVFFTTARPSDKIDADFNFMYVANTSLLKQRGEYMIFEYAPFFQLNQEELDLVFEYFKYWDILRICCGKQMSKSWRQKLKGETDEMHQCDLYDISNVEKSFMNSQLYKEMKSKNMGRMLKPSLQDGELSGKYCEEYNDGVKRCGWGFNSKQHHCP